jgi:hypothetical protein
MKNFYEKFRFKLVKFNNFDTPLPNLAAPSSSIWKSPIKYLLFLDE